MVNHLIKVPEAREEAKMIGWDETLHNDMHHAEKVNPQRDSDEQLGMKTSVIAKIKMLAESHKMLYFA